MTRTVKQDIFYPYSCQRVWQVLTNSRVLAAWLMENDFEPRLGHKFCFYSKSLPGLDSSIKCEVIELDEPKRLVYTWQDSSMNQPSIVTWTLEPVEDGTRLHLEHKVLEAAAIGLRQPVHSQPFPGQFMYELKPISQTLTPITHAIPSQSIPFDKYQALDSVLLNSFLNGGWDYRLNERLPQLLIDSTSV